MDFFLLPAYVSDANRGVSPALRPKATCSSCCKSVAMILRKVLTKDAFSKNKNKKVMEKIGSDSFWHEKKLIEIFGLAQKVYEFLI